MQNRIDARTLRHMFLAGTIYLRNKKDWINELNVFPVPDGDTGTNMMLTLMSAVRELQNLPEQATMDEIGRKIASGTLRGARGNSGVIMSQLCRGFTKGIEGHEEIDPAVLAQGLSKAVSTAYKAVMKPKEGTILTVARVTGERAEQLAGEEIALEDMINELVVCAEEILAQTPEMLPVLKEAGVVDSGGQGLLEFLKGARDAFMGIEIEETFEEPQAEASVMAAPAPVRTANIETADIKYIYCTEFIIEMDRAITEEEEEELRTYLSSIGDSLVCVCMDDVVKIHVHTNHPGEAIEKALTYGQLNHLKIDNMRFEHNERLTREIEQEPKNRAPEKEYGFISVCSGDGLAEIFRDLNVDEVIEGGQTMNPSTEDIMAAARKVPAGNIFVLPNNGNIILTANQAKDLITDKNLVVIPTANVCQGISAMIEFNPENSIQENEKEMTRVASATKCGEVTYAVRNTRIDGSRIKKGDYMGIGGGSLLSVSKDLDRAVLDMIRALSDDDTALVTIYYGVDVTEEDAKGLADMVQMQEPDAEITVLSGGQQVYHYIVSVE